MSKGYLILDAVTGAQLGNQSWDDQFAPITPAGQRASPYTAGGGAVSAGTFTATGTSSGILLFGDFNFSLRGTYAGNVVLEKSFDGGTVWIPVSIDGTGTPVAWYSGGATALSASIVTQEVELGVLYRVNCDSYAFGSAFWRISQ